MLTRVLEASHICYTSSYRSLYELVEHIGDAPGARVSVLYELVRSPQILTALEMVEMLIHYVWSPCVRSIPPHHCGRAGSGSCGIVLIPWIGLVAS